MKNILEFTLSDLISDFTSRGLKPFQAKQVYKWLHHKLTFDPQKMTDLSKELRRLIGETYSFELPKIKNLKISKDKTRKYLFELADGERVEAVLMQTSSDRKTVCLSTQVGCPLACTFCATGAIDFKRNLTAAEILGQAYGVAREYPDISNIVYMGMGEPFLNYDNVIKSINLLLSDEGPNFAQRRITVSTCGIPDKIIAFARENSQVRLAVSLNSADGAVRSRLMPINKKYSLDKLMAAVKYYLKTTGRRVTFEYVMLDGINDRTADAEKLVRLCQNLNLAINLIVFNKIDGPFRPSARKAIDNFMEILGENGLTASVRRNRGEDIAAACGQLAAKMG